MIVFDLFRRPVKVRPWNGTTPGGRAVPWYRPGDLLKDAEGNIWYAKKDGSGCAAIWCAASRLEQHVHRLQQIAAR